MMEEFIYGLIFLVIVHFPVMLIGNLATIFIHKENTDLFDYRGVVIGWLYVGGIWIVLYLFGVVSLGFG
jgi:hypothetical protein